MRAQFIGVGEAFDERYPNTSILVSLGPRGERGHVLLDCGFTAAAAFYACSPVGPALDAVWISHFHGDHYFGLPLLMLRFQEEGRTRPLTVVGQSGMEEKLWGAFELAYPAFRQRLRYPVRFMTASAGEDLELLDARWSFAAGDHNILAPCLAVRLDCRGKSIFYSGDGRPTPSTANLAQGVDLLIHEAYGIAPDTPGHGGVQGCLELARDVQARTLALVHVNRMLRRDRAGAIRKMLSTEYGPRGMLPEPGDVVEP